MTFTPHTPESLAAYRAVMALPYDERPTAVQLPARRYAHAEPVLAAYAHEAKPLDGNPSSCYTCDALIVTGPDVVEPAPLALDPRAARDIAWANLIAMPLTTAPDLLDSMAGAYEVASAAYELSIAPKPAPAERVLLVDFAAHCAIEYVSGIDGKTYAQWDVKLSQVLAVHGTTWAVSNAVLKYRHGGTPGGTWSRPFSTVEDYLDAILAEVATAALDN